MSVAWSVIVPTHNRPQQLARCLAALARLQPPTGGFEVIIVNDGGVDVSAVVSASSAANVRLLTQANAGPGAARNHGAREAAGRWLAFTDDDCEPEASWLLAFDRSLAANPRALAGGTVVNSLVDNVYSETSQQLASFVEGWFDESLSNWNEPIAALYLDVDLALSTRACLKYLYPWLVPGGVLYSQDGHIPLVLEVFEDRDFWRMELNSAPPRVEGIWKRKLIKIRKPERD